MKLYRVLGREGKITIPHAMRQHIGFGESDIVSFELVSVMRLWFAGNGS